jgi:hypothetical protein
MIRERHSLLKGLIYRFQRVLYRTINNYIIKKKVKEDEIINEEEDYFNNKFENLIEKFSKKLTELDLVSQKGTHLVFKHWKNFSENVVTNVTDLNELNDNIDKNISIINFEKLNKFDSNGNLILFYFINELIKLFKYNDNKVIRMNLTALIIDYININFSIYNEEKTQNNKDYKRFWYIINSALYLDEIKDKVSIEDLNLLCWYPNLTPKDERKLHKDLIEYKICGEWFKSNAIDKILEIITEENKAYECSKKDAIKSRSRL